MKYIYIFLGGGFGSLARYIVSIWGNNLVKGSFPLGTFFANIIGAFLIGFLSNIFFESLVSPEIRLFVLTGFLGGFTTFSTFMLESINLAREGEILNFFVNVIGSNIFGLLAVFVGIVLSRLILKAI